MLREGRIPLFENSRERCRFVPSQSDRDESTFKNFVPVKGETKREMSIASLHAIDNKLSGKPGAYSWNQTTLLKTFRFREGRHGRVALPGI